MTTNTDMTLTLLEDRFFSSRYRTEMLEDTLRRNSGKHIHCSGFVDAVRALPDIRCWEKPNQYDVMYITFGPTQLCSSLLASYLLVIYETVETIGSNKDHATFRVTISQQDADWIKVVSSHTKKDG